MKGMKRFVALLLILVMAFPIQGYASEPDSSQEEEYSYEVNEDGNSVTITRYTGDSGDVVIPSEIDGRKVTGIGSSAFKNRIRLTSVTIPDSVTGIGCYTFLGF